MKATIEIPDVLYRRVKARTAMEGIPLRAVAVELFRRWLETPELFSPQEVTSDRSNEEPAPWLAVTRPHLRPEMSHDLEAIRSDADEAWKGEISAKEKLGKERRG